MFTLLVVYLDGLRLGFDGKVEDVFGTIRAAFAVVSSFEAGTRVDSGMLGEQEIRRQVKLTSGRILIRPMQHDDRTRSCSEVESESGDGGLYRPVSYRKSVAAAKENRSGSSSPT